MFKPRVSQRTLALARAFSEDTCGGIYSIALKQRPDHSAEHSADQSADPSADPSAYQQANHGKRIDSRSHSGGDEGAMGHTAPAAKRVAAEAIGVRRRPNRPIFGTPHP